MAKKPVTSPAPLYRIEKRLTPKAKAAFAAAVRQWRQDVAAGRALNPAALRALVRVTEDGLRLAGTAAAVQIGGLRPGISLAFDLINPAAVRWAKTNAARLIREITDETQHAVRRAIVQSMGGKMTVGQVAKFVRSRVGLTVTMNDAVQAFFERALESGYSTADALDEMYVYTERLIRHRSEVIARTEVLRAENRGQELLWDQAKSAGMLGNLQRMWLATGDDLWCDICKRMHHQVTPIGSPWVDPETGDIYETPQDSHPQCRCSQGLVEGR